jgi:putative protease
MEQQAAAPAAAGGAKTRAPMILAPAGNRPSFLAALAAGADAVYCGLKAFSARMEAPNFTLEELRQLADLARGKGTQVFVTLNTLVRPEELTKIGRLLDRLTREVRPAAVIVQDLAMAPLARQTGFTGAVIWSTLANVSFPSALSFMRGKLPVDSVVLPRELSVDEIKAMAAACPPGLGLEVFVHGALCYGVSGRCYWSSFLGGKSGLRGRCVQPCRRVFSQAEKGRRLFSCQDLSVDVLAKVLLSVPQIRAWKIEGRKKGPHYVYYTVSAYRMLRDQAGDSGAKKAALALLARALGRPGTHYHLLSQRPQNPVNPSAHTGSGLFIGRTRGGVRDAFVSPFEALLPGDVLRVGSEDEAGHRIERIGRAVPKGGRHRLNPAGRAVPKGTAVYLIDRREKALEDRIRELEGDLAGRKPPESRVSSFQAALPAAPARTDFKPTELRVSRRPRRAGSGRSGLWLSREALEKTPAAAVRHTWWWLSPAVFPDDEAPTRELIDDLRSGGGRIFVLNAPWQAAFFAAERRGATLWAGPFCNLANPLALAAAADLGFDGAVVGPELSAADYLSLPGRSPLPLGIVVSGHWPLCVARTAAEELELDAPFKSPKGEEAWAARHGPLYWVYPNWRLELQEHRESLRRAGYGLFVHLDEPVPRAVSLKRRPGLWNWKGELK